MRKKENFQNTRTTAHPLLSITKTNTFHNAQHNVHHIGPHHAIRMIVVFDRLIEHWKFTPFFVIEQTQVLSIKPNR